MDDKTSVEVDEKEELSMEVLFSSSSSSSSSVDRCTGAASFDAISNVEPLLKARICGNLSH